MLKLAIVDDKPSDAAALSALLLRYPAFQKEAPLIDTYDRGLTFLDHFKKLYDIVFLDINMPVLNGLDLGKRIRELDEATILIFTTNYGSLAINGYEVNAMDFLVKPIKAADLFSALDKALKRLADRQAGKTLIRIKHGYKAIAASDIYFVEVVRHELIFHCLEGEFSSRGALKSLEEDLGDTFAKCSNCYLVNLAFVDSVVGDEVYLPHGIHLAISRSKKQEFLSRFLSYLS